MVATIRDIAARVGVTDRTVASVLAGVHKGVRSDARLRANEIRQLAEQLGYRPNAAARSTRTGQFKSVAVVSRGDVMRMQSDLVRSIHDSLAGCGQNLSLSLIDPDALASKAPRLLRELCVDGMIVHYAKEIGGETLDLIRRSKTPTVWINLNREQDCVYPDDADGAAKAVATLVGLGHRHICYAYCPYGRSDHLDTHYSVTERRLGYLREMQCRGLEPCVVELPRHDQTLEAQVGMWTTVLQQHLHATAWVTRLHSDAACLLMAACRLGLSVPRDLSVVGFSTNSTHEFGFALSTAAVPMARVGQCAVAMLNRKIHGAAGSQPSEPVPYEAPTEGTIGPAKNSEGK